MDSKVYGAFTFQVWDTHRFKFSRYVVEYPPKELENYKYPKFIYKESQDDYKTVGYTNLSKAQLKVAVEKRRYTIADFYDKGDTWYCFFRTMAGISGNEVPHEGDPHYHYISSAWGIPRDQILQQLKSYRHNIPSAIHIHFKRE